MATQFKPVNLDALRRTTRADFYAELEVRKQQSVWKDVSFTLDSDADQEVMAFFGSLPRPYRSDARGGAGTYRKPQALRDYSLTVVNATWRIDTPIAREIIEDAKLDQVNVRARQAAERAMAWYDERFTVVLEANGNGYDANPFFGGTHERATSAAKDNDITLTVTDPESPTVTEFENMVDNVVETIYGITDDQDGIANAGDLALIWMVPPKYIRPAKAVIEVGPVAGQTGNSGVFKGMGRVLSNPYLTRANDFIFAFSTASSVKPVVYQTRMDWETKLIVEGDKWEDDDEGRIKGRARFEFALADWKKAVRGQFV